MKSRILRFNQSNTHSKNSFLAIREGTKIIETRAATPRYRTIQAGDELIFVCGKLKCKKRINKIIVFKTIAALLKKYPFKKIAPFLSTKEECENMYLTFPNYQAKISRFGLIAMELE